jgi:hypothetical protein
VLVVSESSEVVTTFIGSVTVADTDLGSDFTFGVLTSTLGVTVVTGSGATSGDAVGVCPG